MSNAPVIGRVENTNGNLGEVALGVVLTVVRTDMTIEVVMNVGDIPAEGVVAMEASIEDSMAGTSLGARISNLTNQDSRLLI